MKEKRLSKWLRALRDQRVLVVDVLLLGIFGAVAARAFMWLLGKMQWIFMHLIAQYSAPALPSEGGHLTQWIGPHGLWVIPLVTTLGGLISGFLVYSFAPEAEGHGTDTAVKSFHHAEGKLRARVIPIKMVASAITIGSGGAAGREGPTALFSAGLGSLFAKLTHRTAEERRMLLLGGMAAGLSAIFRSPIGTAIFAIEVLYGDMEFEAQALIYTMLASVIAYAVNGVFVGYQPLFEIPKTLAAPAHLSGNGWYVVLGLVSGIFATLIPEVFYRLRDLFKRIPGPPHIKPAIGGLLVGLIAMRLPQVLGGGYGWIQLAIDGKLAIGLLLGLGIVKAIAFALTVGSGGSGGVFAPSLYVGAMVGAAMAYLTHQSVAAFAVVGIAAVFAGAARVPIATLLMVVEMTGGYELLVPAGLAVMLSYIVQGKLSSHFHYGSLYEAQVPRRHDSPAHHLEEFEAVADLLSQHPLVLPANVKHLDLRNLLASKAPIDLPDEAQLFMADLGAKSSWANHCIADGLAGLDSSCMELVAVLREGHTYFPRSDFDLHAGDRLIIIAPTSTRPKLLAELG